MHTMLFKARTREKSNLSVKPVATPAISTHIGEMDEAELRRQMYERIAQGNALAEAEDQARKLWRGN